MGRRFSSGIVSCNIKFKDALEYTDLIPSMSGDLLGRVLLKIKIDRSGTFCKDEEGEIRNNR